MAIFLRYDASLWPIKINACAVQKESEWWETEGKKTKEMLDGWLSMASKMGRVDCHIDPWIHKLWYDQHSVHALVCGFTTTIRLWSDTNITYLFLSWTLNKITSWIWTKNSTDRLPESISQLHSLQWRPDLSRTHSRRQFRSSISFPLKLSLNFDYIKSATT